MASRPNGEVGLKVVVNGQAIDDREYIQSHKPAEVAPATVSQFVKGLFPNSHLTLALSGNSQVPSEPVWTEPRPAGRFDPDSHEALLVALLLLAENGFAEAGRFGRAFENDRVSSGMQVDRTAWRQHSQAFENFCQWIGERRDVIQNPPSGFNAVARYLKNLAVLAKEIRNKMQSREGQEWAAYSDYYPALNTVYTDGMAAIEQARSALLEVDPLDFVDESRAAQGSAPSGTQAKTDRKAKTTDKAKRKQNSEKTTRSGKSLLEAEKFRRVILEKHFDRNRNLLYTPFDRQTLCHELGGISESTLSRRFKNVWGVEWSKYEAMCNPDDESMKELKRQLEFLEKGTTEKDYLAEYAKIAKETKEFADWQKATSESDE